jgi:hypothetical protein
MNVTLFVTNWVVSLHLSKIWACACLTGHLSTGLSVRLPLAYGASLALVGPPPKAGNGRRPPPTADPFDHPRFGGGTDYCFWLSTEKSRISLPDDLSNCSLTVSMYV